MSNLAIKKRIGVLGGMGPEATVLLMSRIIAMTSVTDDSDHVSMIVDNDTQVPSRIKALIENNGDDPGPTLAAMARGLVVSGAAALAMPCNTAHYYASVIEQSVDIPLLNMIELSVARVAAMTPKIQCIGILASPVIKKLHLYDDAFRNHNIESLYPSNQNQMLDAIRRVKANSKDTKAKLIMKEAALELIEIGADCLLIACSELSIIADAAPDNIPQVDTIDVLANSVIEFSGATLKNIK